MSAMGESYNEKQNVYVKTDGPVPEYLTAGKVYELIPFGTDGGVLVIDDTGLERMICIGEDCQTAICTLPWTLCDQHGNPVAAPWEGEKNVLAESMALIADPPSTPRLDAIDYRAHAAVVAERDALEVRSAELERALREAVGGLHNVCSVSHMCNGCVSYETASSLLNANHGFEGHFTQSPQSDQEEA